MNNTRRAAANRQTPPSRGSAARRLALRLAHDRAGNVLMMTGFAIIPLTFAVGFGVDYSHAMKMQTRLDAASDAAALSAVTASAINQASNSTCATSDANPSINNTMAIRALSNFVAQIPGYSGSMSCPNHTAHSSSGSMADTEQMTVAAPATSSLSGSVNVTVTVSTTTLAGGLSGRKVVVTYSAMATDYFGGIYAVAGNPGQSALPISGHSTATAAPAPNIDFYLAMDNSPSMLLPSTNDGLTKETAGTTTTQLKGGCDFACHEQLPHSDNIYINDTSGRQVLLSSGYYGSGSTANTYYLYDPITATLYNSAGTPMNSGSTTYSVTDSTSGPVTIHQTVGSAAPTTYDSGWWADGYWLTHNYGTIHSTPTALTLRRDDEISAGQQLIPFAQGESASYNTNYRLQFFSFDWKHPNATSPVTSLKSMTNVNYLSGFSVSGAMPVTDYWFKNSWYNNISGAANDMGTDFTTTLKDMTTTIGTPGNGTNAKGDTPQAILFMVTDGMADEPVSGGGRYFGPLSAADLKECTALKAKGVKIAILYTQYLPQALVGDGWSQSNVAPYLPPPPSPFPAGGAGTSDQVLTALQSCASNGAAGTPLVQSVTSDGDFTAALQQLFIVAVSSATIVQ